MRVDGRHDTFEIWCEDCDETDLDRRAAETPFEDFHIVCPVCGGEASVEDDSGIVKVYPSDGASIGSRVV